MPGFPAAPLAATLSPHSARAGRDWKLSPFWPAGLANCRTVNLSNPSSRFPGNALLASSHRRLQRFSNASDWMRMWRPG